MKIYTEYISIPTKGNNDIIDITDHILKVLRNSKIKDGILTIFVVGSTVGLTTIEYEPGLKKDFPEIMEKIAPRDRIYHHDNTWQDGNGYAHIRSSLIGTSLSVPVDDGRAEFGTWQQPVLIDFDNRPRERKIIFKIIGE
ncbi:MAG: hypothetical protein IGBAC_1753 [Ignavibacteriae bacterium]|nr:MAG: hypothetical protein IGBAC_1753 [Ignavibacteriota bacterium]